MAIKVDRVIDLFSESAPQRELAACGSDNISVRGVVGSAVAVTISSLYHTGGGRHLIICNDQQQAAYLYNDIVSLIGSQGIYYFPSAYKKSILFETIDPSAVVQRTALLAHLSGGDDSPMVVCTYPEAVIEKVATQSVVESLSISISAGDKLSTSFLEETLYEYGFQRVDFVYAPGQYAVRGSIVDIFSYSHNYPYRIDMFSDEVDSIRIFDINTQLSVEKLQNINIVASLEEKSDDRGSILEVISKGATPKPSLWSFSWDGVIEKIKALRVKLIKVSNEDSQRSHLADMTTALQDFQNYFKAFRHISLREELYPNKITFNTAPQPAFNKNFEMLYSDLKENALNGYSSYIITENKAQIERLENIFASIGEKELYFDNLSTSLHEGFVSHDTKMGLYTDHQIFERYHRYTIGGELPKSTAMTIEELTALRPGDYVVHIDHGIGQYGGLMKSNEGGKINEMVKIVYLNGDVLLLNVHSLHKISKYRDKEGERPKINKLGSPAWSKLKSSAKSKVKDIAKDLIKLYAQRRSIDGFAFSGDSYLQNELEASFIYEDTPDQQKVTEDIKRDMERKSPMDRLICGDVGFGKTELAIRAAFKAACDGKQVALLVPTTVLAIQHYRTFSRRLREFPVRIEQLSRTKSAAQTKEILSDLEKGKIDILVGTHKILGKSVKFRDLGMLIIDEEQKFGVSSKEKLRQLKQSIDTLTLTATPIPRTLQFSLMGARDLSIIKTPPPNRQSVDTQVLPFSEELIGEAIAQEMERGGQIFFIHNRVQTIEHIGAILKRIAPDARIAIGHGQMAAEKLERVMMDFIYGEYDILLATTIIESGIDIPGANTIIINDAQNFGLSDLHQLRGRVGRTNRKAYCYLLTPEGELLSETSRRRLNTIEDFSELGSGFNIAMQDLDIRGAGNLLGGEQSGFITQIGYETYQQILTEAVAELREEMYDVIADELPQGEEIERSYITSCQIDTDIQAYIPDSYCHSSIEKIRLYKRIDSIERDEEIFKIKEELIDRFGPLPQPTDDLINIVLLRNKAIKLAFEKVVFKNNQLILHFIASGSSSYYKSQQFQETLKYVNSLDGNLYKLKSKSDKLYITIAGVKGSAKALDIVNNFIKNILQ